MPLPPLKDVLEALQLTVLPGAGGAALVLGAFLLLGRWAGALGSAAAVAVGFVWGNFTLAKLNGAPPTWANTWRLIPWAPDADAAGYQWLARSALVLVVVGLVSRWLGMLAARMLPERSWWGANVFVWAPRVSAVLLVSGWLVRGQAAQAEEWAFLRWQLVLAMIVAWVALDGIARNGASAQVALYAGAILLTGGVMMLYTHNARFMELAVLVGSALFGVAVANALVEPDMNQEKPDTSGAIPAVVAFLPGLLLGARPSMADHHVPVMCFWLVALAPAGLLLFLLPAVARKSDWQMGGVRKSDWQLAIGRAILVLLPLVVAVVLAAKHETLAFE